MLPSNGVFVKSPRHGPLVAPPSCGIAPPLALSLLRIMMVLSSIPASLMASRLTDAVVHLADDIGEQAAALGGLADEVRVADHRRMHLGVTHVNKEGLFRGRIALDELDRLRDDVLSRPRWRALSDQAASPAWTARLFFLPRALAPAWPLSLNSGHAV